MQPAVRIVVQPDVQLAGSDLQRVEWFFAGLDVFVFVGGCVIDRLKSLCKFKIQKSVCASW